MDAPGAQGEDTFFIEQQLVDGTLGMWVGEEGGIFLQVVSVKRGDAALEDGSSGRTRGRKRTASRVVSREGETHICIASPYQLLARVEGAGGDNRGKRLPARWREELTTQLVVVVTDQKDPMG